MLKLPSTRLPFLFAFILAFLASIVFDNKAQAQDIIAAWHFPNNPDDSIVDIANPLNTGKTVQLIGADSLKFDNIGASSYCAWATNRSGNPGWTAAIASWNIDINTIGYTSIYLDSKQRSSNTGPKDFKIQYKISAGSWTDVPGGTVVVGDNFTTGVVTGLLLPAACDNQSSVQIRWLVNSTTAVNNGLIGTGGTSRIDDIYIQSFSTDYFRSIQNGNWNQTSTWEQSADNITWVPAYSTPGYRANTITLQSPFNVTVTASITIDQVEINSGATLTYAANGSTITINDGSGIDLMVNGTFNDAGSNSIVWVGSARWLMGSSGTLIRSRPTASNAWQNAYNGGISAIPPTSNWIIRYTGNGDPIISSTGAYYPNLTFENANGGSWTPSAVGSFFTGTTGYPIILGNLDIGGAGSGTVTFTSDNTHASLVAVDGNIRVRSGNTLRNNGSGFETKSNLIVDGALTYSGAGTRIIRFAGANPQIITGSGTFNIYEFAVNKSANSVSLTANLNVDQTLRLSAGVLNLNSKTFSLTGATSSILRFGTSYVLSESPPGSGYGFISWNINTRFSSFEFPFGNSVGTYIPVLISKSLATDIGFLSIATYPTIPNNTPYPLTVTHVRNNSNVDNSNNTVDRFWQIDKTGPSGSIHIFFYYALIDSASSGNTNMEAQRWNFINEGWEPGLPSQVFTPVSGVTRSIVRVNNVTNFGTFAIANKTTPLPVSLLNFEGKNIGNTVKLDWITGSEKDNDRFELMRSFDGRNFKKIASVTGHGTSSVEHKYSYTDDDNWAGLGYYRLDQIDYDGTFTLGPMIAIKKSISSKPDIVYLNSEQEYVWQSTTDFNTGILQWIDITGHIIQTESRSADSNQLQIRRPSDLAPGIYFLRWTGKDQRSIRLLITD